MLNKVQNVQNWHYYIYAFLFALDAVCLLSVAGALAIPPGLASEAPYAGIASAFLGAFLPRIQTQTGPGAPDILSPPGKNAKIGG